MSPREWLESLRKSEDYTWMTDDQFECFVMACDLYGGEHHLPGRVKPLGKGIEINARYGDLATFDFDKLTRAVFMAHDRCIRFGIEPSGPGMLKLCLFRRHKRDGAMWERHPSIETALAGWRMVNPSPDAAGIAEAKE